MRLSANETTMPRLHLIGTLVLILVVTLAMTGFFSWQNEQAQDHAFERVAQVLTQQEKERLTAEMRSARDYVDFLRQRTEDVLRRRGSGRWLSCGEALRPVQFFDGRGYLFIDDMEGRFVLLPTAPQYEGTVALDNQDDQGTYIMRGLISAARQIPGTSFFRYRWYRPDKPLQMVCCQKQCRHKNKQHWKKSALPPWPGGASSNMNGPAPITKKASHWVVKQHWSVSTNRGTGCW